MPQTITVYSTQEKADAHLSLYHRLRRATPTDLAKFQTQYPQASHYTTTPGYHLSNHFVYRSSLIIEQITRLITAPSNATEAPDAFRAALAIEELLTLLETGDGAAIEAASMRLSELNEQVEEATYLAELAGEQIADD